MTLRAIVGAARRSRSRPAPPRSTGRRPRTTPYDVLVFSKTAGFRHDSIAGRHPGDP